MLDLFAAAVVLLTGLYLIALAALSLFAPARAAQFLGGFATSALTHYAELAVRLCAGAALVVYAPHMRFAEAFALAGWVLIVTTAALLVVPWRWHQRFARWAVPQALPHLRLVAAASVLFGCLVLGCMIAGAASGRWG
jgi:hypothetical protein